MNENVTNDGTATASVPLIENEHVKELLGILNDNKVDSKGLMALLNHVKGMEDFCKQAENKIADMKCQLDEMKEIQSHPIKTMLQDTIKSLEEKVAAIREQISELKANIIDGCKNAVAAFKDKGVTALDKLASFFRVKSCLEKIKNNTISVTKDCDKALVKIETFSQEYHFAARGLKNMARVIIGKEPIDAVKESGKLAHAFGAPYRAHKTCMSGIRKATNAAIVKVDQLSHNAEVKQEEKAAAKRPSLEERLKENKELVRLKDLERGVPERSTQSRGVAI